MAEALVRTNTLFAQRLAERALRERGKPGGVAAAAEVSDRAVLERLAVRGAPHRGRKRDDACAVRRPGCPTWRRGHRCARASKRRARAHSALDANPCGATASSTGPGLGEPFALNLCEAFEQPADMILSNHGLPEAVAEPLAAQNVCQHLRNLRNPRGADS